MSTLSLSQEQALESLGEAQWQKGGPQVRLSTSALGVLKQEEAGAQIKSSVSVSGLQIDAFTYSTGLPLAEVTNPHKKSLRQQRADARRQARLFTNSEVICLDVSPLYEFRAGDPSTGDPGAVAADVRQALALVIQPPSKRRGRNAAPVLCASPCVAFLAEPVLTGGQCAWSIYPMGAGSPLVMRRVGETQFHRIDDLSGLAPVTMHVGDEISAEGMYLAVRAVQQFLPPPVELAPTTPPRRRASVTWAESVTGINWEDMPVDPNEPKPVPRKMSRKRKRAIRWGFWAKAHPVPCVEGWVSRLAQAAEQMWFTPRSHSPDLASTNANANNNTDADVDAHLSLDFDMDAAMDMTDIMPSKRQRASTHTPSDQPAPRLTRRSSLLLARNRLLGGTNSE